MFNVNRFINEQVTFRNESLFAPDIEKNRNRLQSEIGGRSVLVIGGAGSIGSSYIRAILPFRPEKLYVVDVSENGLTELTRDLRSSYDLYVPEKYKTYPVSYSDPLFEKMFRQEGGFDIVANFSAHKHVRSEKDVISCEALLENNVIRARQLLDLLLDYPPRHFFCVSTDKAANPVNIMGASKKIMEEMIMAYADRLAVTTARFANVAFSNGSLLAGFVDRVMKGQPLAAPNDVRRYFVSPDESGQICMLACLLGSSGEIYFPRLSPEQMLTFSEIADRFLRALGYEPLVCSSEEEARRFAAFRRADDNRYPVFYFTSDTSGEKSCEEFYTEQEIVDLNQYRSLGVIKEIPRRTPAEIDALFDKFSVLFSGTKIMKADIVAVLKSFITTFDHLETGKSLDAKM